MTQNPALKTKKLTHRAEPRALTTRDIQNETAGYGPLPNGEASISPSFPHKP